MIVPAFFHQKQATSAMLQLANGVFRWFRVCQFFKPTVVEDGNDQDHERREIKLPDQRDQHEPELHIYSHHQSLWFSWTNPTGEQSHIKNG